MATAAKERPYKGNFFFKVEINGVVQAHFFSCTGLSTENEVYELQEGGVNGYVHKRQGQTKYSPIVLKRGWAPGNNEFTSWRKTIYDGSPMRYDGSIILLNDKGDEVGRWNFVRAWPAKWEGPELNSQGNEMAVETLELSHEGIWPA